LAIELRPAEPARQPFPRPRVSLRELVGLVVAFAVSNALLLQLLRAGYRPLGVPSQSTVPAFAVWNGTLLFYLAFSYLQAWIRAIIEWRWFDRSRARRRYQPRWTALGVAEGTVIGGTLGYWLVSLVQEVATGSSRSPVWGKSVLALLTAAVTIFIALRFWRART
jgi:hypothetical protein